MVLYAKSAALMDAVPDRDSGVPYTALLSVADPSLAKRLAPVSGRVIDGKTNRPLVDVLVYVAPSKDNKVMDATLTGPDGSFALRVLPGFDYRLRVVNDRYFPDLPLTPGPKGCVGILFRVVEPPPLIVHVLDADGRPAPSAGLRVLARMGDETVVGAPDQHAAGMVRVPTPRTVISSHDRYPAFGHGIPVGDTFPHEAPFMGFMLARAGYDGSSVELLVNSPAGSGYLGLPQWTTEPQTIHLARSGGQASGGSGE